MVRCPSGVLELGLGNPNQRPQRRIHGLLIREVLCHVGREQDKVCTLLDPLGVLTSDSAFEL